MDKWLVTDIRWANEGDLALPYWRIWNAGNPLPKGFWQRIWEYPYVNSRIPGSGNVLDIGGTYPDILFKNFPSAKSVDIRDLNQLDHPMHKGKWPKERLIISDASAIPVEGNSFDYTMSISAIEEMPSWQDVLSEMLRIARHRVVVTMDVSDQLGLPLEQLKDLEQFLGVRIPEIPRDPLTSESGALRRFRQSRDPDYSHIRVLAFTIDAREATRSVGIILPHWNSWDFLRLCLESIQKNRNPLLKETVYVIDDTSDDGSYETAAEYFKHDESIRFVREERANKQWEPDVGLLLDRGLTHVRDQYTAMIDADIVALSPDWLAFPISLIERYHCSSVGFDSGLSAAYRPRVSNRRWWMPAGGYVPPADIYHGLLPRAGFYDNEWFSCTNNLYRIMPTCLAKVVSESIGFTRNSLVPPTLFNKGIMKIRALTPATLPGLFYPYMLGGADNGVAANHFIDVNRLGPKFNIPLTGCIGLTPGEGAFGQNISGLVFHFALSTRALSQDRREVDDAGSSYYQWVDRIRSSKDLSDILGPMIEASEKFPNASRSEYYGRQYRYILECIREYHSFLSINHIPDQQ